MGTPKLQDPSLRAFAPQKKISTVTRMRHSLAPMTVLEKALLTPPNSRNPVFEHSQKKNLDSDADETHPGAHDCFREGSPDTSKLQDPSLRAFAPPKKISTVTRMRHTLAPMTVLEKALLTPPNSRTPVFEHSPPQKNLDCDADETHPGAHDCFRVGSPDTSKLQDPSLRAFAPQKKISTVTRM